MATFRTYAEVLKPDHPLMRPGRATVGGGRPGVVLGDVLRRTGGVYETTTPLTAKFRGYIREVAELTSDDELLRIAELPEVPVSLETAASWIRKPALPCSPGSTSARRRPHDGGGSRPAASPPPRGPTSMIFFAGVAVLASRSMRFRTAGTGAIQGRRRTSRHNPRRPADWPSLLRPGHLLGQPDR
jgi:hypothetical protein